MRKFEKGRICVTHSRLWSPGLDLSAIDLLNISGRVQDVSSDMCEKYLHLVWGVNTVGGFNHFSSSKFTINSDAVIWTKTSMSVASFDRRENTCPVFTFGPD